MPGCQERKLHDLKKGSTGWSDTGNEFACPYSRIIQSCSKKVSLVFREGPCKLASGREQSVGNGWSEAGSVSPRAT